MEYIQRFIHISWLSHWSIRQSHNLVFSHWNLFSSSHSNAPQSWLQCDGQESRLDHSFPSYHLIPLLPSGMYMVTVLSGLFIHLFLVLFPLYIIFVRKNPLKLVKGVAEMMAVAFGTSSRLGWGHHDICQDEELSLHSPYHLAGQNDWRAGSMDWKRRYLHSDSHNHHQKYSEEKKPFSVAALPLHFKCLQENMGVSKMICQMVLPVACTVNMVRDEPFLDHKMIRRKEENSERNSPLRGRCLHLYCSTQWSLPHFPRLHHR